MPSLVMMITVSGGALVMAGQSSTSSDAFTALTPLLGRWEGTSEGSTRKRHGAPRVHARARWAIHSGSNRSEYPPQEKNPNGEVHEDEGFIGFDRSRRKLVFRQFHIEGLVSRYIEEESSAAKIVFTSEAIENIRAGFGARETYLIASADEFEEVFELAEPGQPFNHQYRCNGSLL